MPFSLPNTAGEFIVTVVPLLTVIIGIAFLIIPRRALRAFGLQSKPGIPDAVAEARSSFAAPYLTVGLACLILQHPLALQPSLMLLLALGWSLAAVGRVFQMMFDQGWRRKRVHLRFVVSATFAIASWAYMPNPYLRCGPGSFELCLATVASVSPIFLFAALLTVALGLLALVFPELGLRILRLQPRANAPFARGEIRGILGGFYIAIGAVFLLLPQPLDFLALVLGVLWLLTGVGRTLSLILDRAWSRYNIMATLFELALGAAILAQMFGYLGATY